MVGEAHPTKAKPLRERMPETAAFIDVCRETFGKECVNEMIRLGIEGAQTFHAAENGIEVGTAMPGFDELKGITLDRMVLREKKEEPWTKK
ncbi:MAG: hypothetical protein A2143_08055 [Gallionellales bacterium RBG_16_57_15]|nr:MAG: hypothetical protein A2143_08055 [Gallionellales bacterium RBG_16_57_15]